MRKKLFPWIVGITVFIWLWSGYGIINGSDMVRDLEEMIWANSHLPEGKLENIPSIEAEIDYIKYSGIICQITFATIPPLLTLVILYRYYSRRKKAENAKQG
jgi:hypothetical protein